MKKFDKKAIWAVLENSSRLFSSGKVMLFIFTLSSLMASHSFAQISLTDTLNCAGGTPTFKVDLSSKSDSTWISSSVSRGGVCCLPTDLNCVQFAVKLSPEATGLSFALRSSCGAAPSGTLKYQVDCGPEIPMGDIVCLTGSGEHVITFCAVGSDINCYAIESIRKPITPSCFAVTDVVCGGNATGVVNTTPIENVVSYSWSNGASSQDLSGLVAGMYTLSAVDNNGCTTSETIQIHENLEIISSPVITNVDCNGDYNGNVDMTISGGVAPYTYLWNTGLVSEDLTSVNAGTYQLVTTDAVGCAVSKTVEVTQPEVLDLLIAGASVSCFGMGDGHIDLTVMGGTLPYTFVWSNGAVTEDIYSLGPGTYVVSVVDAKGCSDEKSITISEPNELILTSSSNNVACFGEATGVIDIEMTGGFADYYYYAWSNGETTQDLTSVNAGTYDVLVTDLYGCTVSSSFVITEPPLMEVMASTTNISCFGFSDGAVDLTATGGTGVKTYTWASGGTTQDLLDVPAGIYSVVVADENSCSESLTFDIIEHSELESSSTKNDISCFGFSDGNIDVSVTGGAGGYSYTWSSTELVEDLTNVPAGVYSLIVSDLNGCTVTENVTLTEPEMLAVTKDILPVTCYGFSDGAVNITITGGTGDYVYSWSNTTVLEDLIGVVADAYTVNVADEHGCTLEETFTVEQPDNLVGALAVTHPLCVGSSDGTMDLSVEGGIPGYIYSWSTTAVSEDVFDLAEGSYTVNIVDANGCELVLSKSLTDPIDYTAGPDNSTTYCSESEVMLDLNGLTASSTLGDWSEAVASSGAFNTATGVLDVASLNAGTHEFMYTIPEFTPCTHRTATITLVINQTPEINVVADDQIGCEPFNVTFENAAFTEPDVIGTWEFGDGTASDEMGEIAHDYANNGMYDVTLSLMSMEGCLRSQAYTDFIQVEKPAVASFAFGPEKPDLINPEVEFQNTSENATDYTWNFADGTGLSNSQNPNHNFPEVGNKNYNVELIASNQGCSDTIKKTVTIFDALLIYVPTAFTPDGNTLNDTFKPVISSGIDIYDYHCVIYNRWGEKVFESYDVSVGWDGYFGTVEPAEEGMYVWSLDFGNSMTSERYLKQGQVTLMR